MRSKEKIILLFADETGFSLHPRLGRMWVQKGTEPVVYTHSQHQKRLNLFGWVAPIQGWHGLLQRPKGNTEGFIAMLQCVMRRFSDWTIELYVDRAPWHKGERIYKFLTNHKKLKLDYLPAYHPELNTQEHVWKRIRYEVTTDVYFETIEMMKSEIFAKSRSWKPKKIQSLCQIT